MSPSGEKSAARLKASWITEEGFLDLRRFPIDSVLKQSLAKNEEDFRTGCSLLGSMQSHGRTEAGVYLLGLLRYWQDDLARLAIIVKNLSFFHTATCRDALLSELRRIPSSNTTRGYLSTILKSLSCFPVELVADGLEALAEDSSFSYKMRRKFRDVLEDMEGASFYP